MRYPDVTDAETRDFVRWLQPDEEAGHGPADRAHGNGRDDAVGSSGIVNGTSRVIHLPASRATLIGPC